MTYSPETDPLAVVLDLGTQYSPVLDPLALDFDLAESGGFVYRKPPLAVTHGYLSAQASQKASDRREQGHALANPQDGSGRHHRSEQARVLGLEGYASGWDRVPPKDKGQNPFSGDEATALDLRAERARWAKVPERDDPAGYGRQAWDVQTPKDRRADQGFNDPRDHNVTSTARASDSILNWQAPPPQVVNLEQDETLNLVRSPYSPPGALVVDFELVPDALLVEVKPPTRSVDSQPNVPGWSLKEAQDGRTIHPWDRKPRLGTEIEMPSAVIPDPPINAPPPEPEIKRTYVVMNSSSLVEAITGTPLEFKGLTIELDADSFAWTMSCTILNRASMDQIRPTVAGPAEVTATINGHEWRFVIERYGINKQFAREAYTVKGVSRSQLLAEPYAPKRTGRIEAQTTMMQVIAEQLQYTGFSAQLQTGLRDFVIPAGAWGWEDKTAMQVITELADSIGAVVVPDQDQDILHIRHRYRQIAPWNYGTLTAGEIDTVIQDAMVISYAGQWEPHPEYNAVFVSGVTDGVAIDVIRTSTPGDKPAPDIFADLNVEASQCRLRGLSAIAASGNQEIVTFETILPTSGSPGLIQPAMLAEYRDSIDPANNWRGNVLGNSISVSNPGTGRVTQNVKIERHYY